MRSDDPGQARNRKHGDPTPIGLADPHNGERREEHQMIRLGKEVHYGIHISILPPKRPATRITVSVL